MAFNVFFRASNYILCRKLLNFHLEAFSVSHSVVFGGYQCKYNSSKKGLLSKSVKFYVTAEERSEELTVPC